MGMDDRRAKDLPLAVGDDLREVAVPFAVTDAAAGSTVYVTMDGSDPLVSPTAQRVTGLVDVRALAAQATVGMHDPALAAGTAVGAGGVPVLRLAAKARCRFNSASATIEVPLVSSVPRGYVDVISKHVHLFGGARARRVGDMSAALAAATGAAAARTPSPFTLPPSPPGSAWTDVPLTQIRKTIAKRLAQSIGPVPTFYLTMEADMTRAAEAREALNALGEGKVSFNDIVIKAVALALRQHPACNAWWQDDRIRYWNEVHISMAVAIEEGLITPVIRHADRKSLREISTEARDLAGQTDLLFRRNSLNGAVECKTHKSAIELNEALHAHN